MTVKAQMTMLREARKVSTGGALDMLDMAGVLQDAGFGLEAIANALDIPVQGNITKLARLQEMLDVEAAWPPEALMYARRVGADWHSLREPARWWRNGKVQREEVLEYVRDYVRRKHKWPRTDDLRRQFGFEVGHKGPGDTAGQGVLLP